METVTGNGQEAGTRKATMVVRIVAAASVVLGGPLLLQALAPTIVMVADIAVAVGHICVAILRANGI